MTLLILKQLTVECCDVVKLRKKFPDVEPGIQALCDECNKIWTLNIWREWMLDHHG